MICILTALNLNVLPPSSDDREGDEYYYDQHEVVVDECGPGEKASHKFNNFIGRVSLNGQQIVQQWCVGGVEYQSYIYTGGRDRRHVNAVFVEHMVANGSLGESVEQELDSTNPQWMDTLGFIDLFMFISCLLHLAGKGLENNNI